MFVLEDTSNIRSSFFNPIEAHAEARLIDLRALTANPKFTLFLLRLIFSNSFIFFNPTNK